MPKNKSLLSDGYTSVPLFRVFLRAATPRIFALVLPFNASSKHKQKCKVNIYHVYILGDSGIYVSKIRKHSAADRAGLEIGDKIISVMIT